MRHGRPLVFGTSQCPYPLALPLGPAFGVVLVRVTPTLRWPGSAFGWSMSSRLLVGRAGVCVEQVGDLVVLAVLLDLVGQRELGAVVGDDDEEQLGHHRQPRVLAEPSDEPVPDRCECRRDVGRGLLVLRERETGVLRDEPLVVFPRAPDAALLVHLVLLALALAGLEPALAREVAVLRRKKPAVDLPASSPVSMARRSIAVSLGFFLPASPSGGVLLVSMCLSFLRPTIGRGGKTITVSQGNCP